MNLLNKTHLINDSYLLTTQSEFCGDIDFGDYYVIDNMVGMLTGITPVWGGLVECRWIVSPREYDGKIPIWNVEAL